MVFWVTERGEIVYQVVKATNHLRKHSVPWDGILIISKNASNEKLHNLLLEFKQNTIFHATITGYGGSKLEPGVPDPDETLKGINDLIDKGFPSERIVLRVDPIIPTEEGLNVAIDIMNKCNARIKRIRISFIDNYPNIKPLQLVPWNTFHAPLDIRKNAVEKIKGLFPNHSIECCGEPDIVETSGCISTKDYDILKLPHPVNCGVSFQRKDCKCLGVKKELLSIPKRCSNGCVYCYYRLSGGD